jgi:putative ABC transport system permease protein
LGSGDPLSKQLIIAGESTPRRVIGVVRDVTDWDLLNKTNFYVYVPYSLDNPERSMTLVVRSNSNPNNLISAARAKIREIDPNQPVSNVKTMEKVIADTRAPQRINMIGLIILASISTILAAMGIYGLISYSVAQRTQEIGVRMALGASPADIARFISKQGLIFTSIGLGAGLIGAFVLTRGLASLIYGISLMDPLTYLSVPLFMILIGLLATYIPARRASKVDPMIALRCK